MLGKNKDADRVDRPTFKEAMQEASDKSDAARKAWERGDLMYAEEAVGFKGIMMAANLNTTLNRVCKWGWEFAQSIHLAEGGGLGPTTHVYLIFRRPKADASPTATT